MYRRLHTGKTYGKAGMKAGKAGKAGNGREWLGMAGVGDFLLVPGSLWRKRSGEGWTAESPSLSTCDHDNLEAIED